MQGDGGEEGVVVYMEGFERGRGGRGGGVGGEGGGCGKRHFLDW